MVRVAEFSSDNSQPQVIFVWFCEISLWRGTHSKSAFDLIDYKKSNSVQHKCGLNLLLVLKSFSHRKRPSSNITTGF